jgi:transcription elongation factor GreA
MAPTTQLSPEAFQRLQAEYDDLTTRGRIEIAKKIEAARELGDLSENGDYHAAKEEQGKMEGRIMHLQRILENATIVEVAAEEADEVRSGYIVSITYAGDDTVERYLIGSIEERRDGIDVMSPGSPLGQALLGARKGETKSYEAPGGTLEVTVVDIAF